MDFSIFNGIDLYWYIILNSCVNSYLVYRDLLKDLFDWNGLNGYIIYFYDMNFGFVLGVV